MRHHRFEIQGEKLAEVVTDTRSGRSFTHRCTFETFEEVAHFIDEQEGPFILDDLTKNSDLRWSQVAVALRFLQEHGLVVHVYPRANERAEDSIHLSAMACLHALKEKA